MIADGGAYMYTSNKVLGNTTLTCTGPYDIPHVAVDTYAVYTNNVPARRSAASAGRRATSRPRVRWTSWPRRWASIRWSCA